MVASKLITCPKCGFSFDVSYSRVFACGGCSASALGDCGFIRCPRCKYEFPSR